MEPDFFQAMDRFVMQTLTSATQGKMMFYSGLIATLIQVSISLYVLVAGYQTFAGKLQTPMEDVIYNLAKFAFILMFVQNVDGWLDLLISALDGLKTGLSGKENVWQSLDQLWIKAQQISAKLLQLDTSTYVKMAGGIGALLTYFGVGAALLLTTIVFLGAEITLLMLGIVSPIFIFCLMFGFLRTMFNNWFQSVLSAIFTIMFASLALSAGTQFLNNSLSKMVLMANESSLMILGLMAGIAGVITGFIVFLASKFATTIAGAGVEGAVQGMLAMGVGGAAALGMKGASMGAGAALGTAKGAGRMGHGMYEGYKGRKWGDRQGTGAASAVGYGAARGSKAMVNKVKEKYRQNQKF